MNSHPHLLAAAAFSLIAAAGVALGGGSAAHSQATTTIQAGDLWFCVPGDTGCMVTDFDMGDEVDIVTEVAVGDTVVWQDIDSSPTDIPHTVTECGDSCDTLMPPTSPFFDSRSDPADDGQSEPYKTYLDEGETYSFTFDSTGTYFYRCELHPFQMRGKVTVLAAAETASTLSPTPTAPPAPPTPTLMPTPTPTPTPTPAPAQPNAVPDGGGAPPADGGTPWPWALVAASGVLFFSSATLLALWDMKQNPQIE